MARPSNDATKERFALLLARVVRRSRVTRILSDSPAFQVPRADGIGTLSLDDVGPPGSPHLRIVWLPPADSDDMLPVDLTDLGDNEALAIVVG